MKPATRLDVVVKLRERDEEAARRALAEAQRQSAAAQEALRDAESRARHDARTRGRASDWLVADAAHARALSDARQAEQHAHAAEEKVGASRTHFAGVHARAEAIRRLAETRRAEIVSEAEAKERKALDEVATLLFVRS